MKRYIIALLFILTPVFASFVYAQEGVSGGVGVEASASDEMTTQITDDTIKPKLNINGPNPYYISLGSEYVELGAYAVDDVDGDISSRIEIVKNIDTDTLGKYLVKYLIRDKAGNLENATREVVVFDSGALSTSKTEDVTEKENPVIPQEIKDKVSESILSVDQQASDLRPQTVISIFSDSDRVTSSDVVSGTLKLRVSTEGAKKVIAHIIQANIKNRIIELEQSTSNKNSWVGKWDTTKINNGPYLIVVFVTSEFGDYRAASVNITIKNDIVDVPTIVDIEPIYQNSETEADNSTKGKGVSRQLLGESLQGCKTATECREVCTKEDGKNECREYVQENIISESGIKIRSVADYITLKQVDDALGDNVGPGGCIGAEECRSYCSSSVNDDECADFLRDNNLLSKDEIKNKQKLLDSAREDRDRIIKERIGVRAFLDSDADGVPDYDEINIYGTDPQNADTDSDGVPDGVELLSYTNPLINSQDIISASTGEEPPENVKEIDTIEYENPQDAGELDSETFTVDTVVLNTANIEDVPSENIVLSGTAPANSMVTLYVFSNTIIVSLKTNEDGSWEYTLTRELEDGTHEAYVALTDSNGKIFAKSKALSFIKQAQAITVGETVLGKDVAKAPNLVGASYTLTLVLIFILGIVFVFIGFRIEGKEENIL